VLIAGLYVRLALAFFPGFPDTDDFVKMVAIVQQNGLSSITNWGVRELPEYPPGFIYEASAASGLVGKLTGKKASENEAGITPWARFGVRIVPMGCDLLAAVLLYLAVVRAFNRTSGVWAASLYLFNPGVIANSALWSFDGIPSFLVLLGLLLCGLAFEKQNHGWLAAGAAACALAFCVKLQAGMFVPVVGIFVLLTRKVRMVAATTLVFCLVSLLLYAPFLLEGDWEYLRRVFLVSFQHGQFTHINAYNAWALWFQLPNTRQVLGISLGNIGRMAYLASLVFAMYALFTTRPAQETPLGATRRFAIVGAYLCAAPFVVLTQMHERYLATAIPLAVLAAFLDRRLLPVGIGFSLTYALNMLAIGVLCWDPWGAISETSPYYEPVKLLFIVNRVFCSLLNVALLTWLTVRLRHLLATNPGPECGGRHSGITSPVSPRGAGPEGA
jgi:4-amino-4-deoxy-L-arabinose transferase-like glycosyltransferase